MPPSALTETAIVRSVTTGREREPLGKLYDELRRFAPSEVADEMSQLAARLADISEQPGDEAEGAIDLGATWRRVELYLSAHPQASVADAEGDLPEA